jgi:hypothetical protein
MQKLYEERYGMELTEEQAADVLQRLMNFIWLTAPQEGREVPADQTDEPSAD